MIAARLAEGRKAREDLVGRGVVEEQTKEEVPARPCPSSSETCAICSCAMEARRHIKTLPCKHSFHFGCIDDFHREKMLKEKDMDLPCYTCGVPSNRSIASVVAERRRKAEEAKAAAVQAEAAAAASERLQTRGRHGGTLGALARALRSAEEGPEDATS
mmetsp:Transcript_58909/g.127400  ORF Transcript_58909/g.127400 Transcript_58909/m.127400 type:complete len:159 (+) Transcript_58909:103-579(+)